MTRGDVIDKANDLAAKFTEDAIAAARANAKIIILNRCRYCGEDALGKNFCNVECRDDFEEESKWQP